MVASHGPRQFDSPVGTMNFHVYDGGAGVGATLVQLIDEGSKGPSGDVNGSLGMLEQGNKAKAVFLPCPWMA